ncbi:MAG: hypothetical protein L0227_15250, partial [Chloroflexi bacterium]|nr:hypothetical protein [Chloroflexota bacterium]
MGVAKAPPAPAKAPPVPSPGPSPAKPIAPSPAGPESGAAGKAGAAKDRQKAAGNQAVGAGDAAPVAPAPPPANPVELKGRADFPVSPELDAYLRDSDRGTGDVPIQFGKLASGTIKVTRKEARKGKGKGKEDAAAPTYSARRHGIALYHPLFRGIEDPATSPKLAVEIEDGQVSGFVGIGDDDKHLVNIANYLNKAPEVLGLAGFDLPKAKWTNAIEAGAIHLGVDTPIVLGAAFKGQLKLDAIDEAIAFDASAEIQGKGLASGTMAMQRSVEGVITGQVAVQLNLPKSFSGGIDVAWDGQAVKGEGKVGYQGDKFSGEVVLKLMEAGEAARLEAERKAPPEQEAKAEAAAEGGAKKPAKKRDKVDYAVFGEGDLTFSFTDWLNGTAHVIVDSKGFVTVIGQITPQKEFQLFEPKEYVKNLFKIEARASYGLPVVGNIFLFANVGMDAFAKLDGKLYNIRVDGTYSTDPEKSKSFSIQGTLNISAGAGLRLRGEGGAGLEVLGHDIKAGAGVNGIAGVKGYAEATPIIGYREQGAPAEDKKGEFYIRGELEIVAQPFLGLSGDLFVELDSPWWSPAPDKKWTWPLGSKEWPIGGSFGIGANVDYVFGSGQMPSVEFKKVDFSADKFMSDLMNDKAKPKSAEG